MKLKSKIAFIQNAIDGLSKDGTNPHFKNSYVTLNQIIDALRPMEVEQKISITMPLTHTYSSDRPGLALVIQDLEGEEIIRDILPLPDLTDPQKMGSAITYYRRYMLMSFFNIKSEDDDGNGARPEPSKEIKKETTKTTNHEDDELGF